MPHGSRPRTPRSSCMTPRIARPRRRSRNRRASSSGSASRMCARHSTGREALRPPLRNSSATTSSRAIRMAGTSASMRWRTGMATTTSTETTTGFDLTLTPEQELIQRTAREFAREKVLPRAKDIDEHKEVPRELVAEMGRLGFMGIEVPERYGGAGLDAVTYVL